MKKDAELLYREKRSYAGGIIEMVVWKLPAPIPPSGHSFKCRLVYVRDGKRMVGYDNERGKGDHKHLGERELHYRFVNEAKLLADFWQDVMEATNEKP